MVKKLKKQYETPNEGWNKERIHREDQLLDEYGLKRKVEVYKAQSELRALRREARKLTASENEEEKAELLKKVHGLGLVKKNAGLEDILTLNVTDILDRRLQTAVDRRGFADTPKEARQLVVHGHVSLGDQRATVPGRLLTTEEEQTLKVELPEPEPETEEPEAEAEEETPEETEEENEE